MSKEVHLPADSHFSCASCGRCCTQWAVTVDEATVTQLRKHDWGADPFVANRGPGGDWRIKLVADRCFFLDDANRCRIHSEISYEAKPEACKAFPLRVGDVAGERFASLSFYCPTVAKDEGKPLEHQGRWIRAVSDAAGPAGKSGEILLAEGTAIAPGDLAAIDLELIELVTGKREAAMSDRLAAGAAMLARVSARVEDTGRGNAVAEVKVAREAGFEKLVAEGREGGSPAKAGEILALFLGQDCAPTTGARLRHGVGVRLYQRGLKKLHSRLMKAAASRSAVAKVAFEEPAAKDPLLARYFAHKLKSRRHATGGIPVIAGYNLLVVAYGVIAELARLKAASSGRGQVNAADITEAVEAADLLVTEHTLFVQSDVFKEWVARALSPVRLTASVLRYASR